MNHADNAIEPGDLSLESERALAILCRALDGEVVAPEAERVARDRLAVDAELAGVWADLRAHHEILVATPAVKASADFAERVVGALAPASTGVILPMVKRLAAAAAITLAVTVGWGVARPALLAADASIEEAYHAVDHFRWSPYVSDDLDAGIDALLRVPDPTSRPRSSGPGRSATGTPMGGAPAGANDPAEGGR